LNQNNISQFVLSKLLVVSMSQQILSLNPLEIQLVKIISIFYVEINFCIYY